MGQNNDDATIQAEMDAATEAGAQAGEGFNQYQKASLGMQIKRDQLHRLQTFLTNLGPCSGQNNDELREWLKAMDYAKEYSGVNDTDFVNHAIAHSREPLRTVLDIFLKKKKEKNEDIKWEQARQEITNACLSADESDYLRDVVEATVQSRFEDIRTYVFRFKEAVRRAYKPEQLKDLILERVLRIMIRGFHNASIRERVILENPKTLDEVGEKAIMVARALHMAHNSLAPSSALTPPTTGFTHEPMEIEDFKIRRSNSKENKNQKPKSPIRKLTDDFDEMQLKNEKSTSRKSRKDFTKNRTRSNSRSKVNVVDDRKDYRSNPIKCLFCKKPNHLIKDCRQKLRQENRCFHCKKIGHEEKSCWSKQGNGPPQNWKRQQFKRGPSTERFNREGLDKKRSSSKEKDHLLADIQDFFSSAKKDLNRKSQ